MDSHKLKGDEIFDLKIGDIPSKLSLQILRAIAHDGAVKSATNSLFAWGAINLGAWIIFGNESRESLAVLSNPGPAIYFLMYSGAIIGGVMLLFGLLGTTLRSSSTILLNGFSLLGVGIWNIGGDIFTIMTLKPYGYTIEKPNTMWIILGVCQAVWGFRELLRFGSVAAWKDAHVSQIDKDAARKTLTSLIKESENLSNGIVKASMNIPGPLQWTGLDILSRVEQYSAQISNDMVIFVTTRMDDYFSISKSSAQVATWGAIGTLTVQCVDNKTRTISLGPLSVFALKKWADVLGNANDILFLASMNKATIEILMPFINAEDLELKAVAVESLGTIDNIDSRNLLLEHLDNKYPKVRIAAVKGVKTLKIKEAQARVLDFLNDTDKDVRSSAAQCLIDIATSDIASQIESALSKETEKTICKDLERALKKIKTNAKKKN